MLSRIFSSAEKRRRVALRMSLTVFSTLSRPLVSLSHRAPSQGYDEPQNLSYAISSICPAGADGGQSKKLSVAALDSHMKKCIADAVGKK